MKDIKHMASLLTYMEPIGNKFFLDLSLLNQNKSFPEENIFPFITINNSDPLAHLIEARVISDAGSEVKKLLLFVQRDLYTLRKNALWPFNNNDVRNCWKKSFSFYAEKKRKDRSFILFSNQVDKKGELLPFSSLFYCKTKKVFFHPLCPKCGQILQQCEDDTLLRISGLHPFSTSLKRYLFCSVCGSPDFFTYDLEQGDPSFLKDGRTLIKKFAELKKTDENTDFPCLGCHLHDECYEKDGRVLERIVPFSFYPFYMFAFEAASLNALDFITIISGADFQEAESVLECNHEFGRAAYLKAVRQACAGNTPFLFDHDERYFLEILYLKLTFLGGVIQNFQSSGSFIHPDLKPAIDQIWVKFPENSEMLPYFWNFKVEILGIGTCAPTPLLFRPSSDSLFLMGLIWFYTLLMNRRQSISDILSCLEKFSSEEIVLSENFIKESVFDPLNIFWDPRGKTIKSSWNSLWERSLKLGWSLLIPSFQKVDMAGEKFLRALDELRKDIKEDLFAKEISYSGTAPNTEETDLHKNDDGAIHEILVDIISKLQKAITRKKEEEKNQVIETVDSSVICKTQERLVPPINEIIEEPVTETVILSARQFEREATLPPAEETLETSRSIPAKKTEDEQETLILSLEDTGHKTKLQTKEAKEFIAETVIISPAEPLTEEAEKTDDQALQKKMTPEELLAETVILKPGEKSCNGTKK